MFGKAVPAPCTPRARLRPLQGPLQPQHFGIFVNGSEVREAAGSTRRRRDSPDSHRVAIIRTRSECLVMQSERGRRKVHEASLPSAARAHIDRRRVLGEAAQRCEHCAQLIL